MPEITTDIEFKQELKKLSDSSLNECMQCGTCTVVCSLSPQEKPFPRKEMIWAGWGLKDKLIGSGDVWLCHQCGDCSTYCPRGVKPSDVLAAVRQISYRHYARPRFMGKILSKPQWLPVATIIPVVVISAILMMAGTFRIPEGEVLYSKFFPHGWLNGSFTLITLFFYGMWVSGLRLFWKDLEKGSKEMQKSDGFMKSLYSIIKSKIILHSEFGKCKTQRSRQTAHILVFFGFIMLLVVTAFAIVATFTHSYPLKFTHPFKILGNVAGLMLVTGLTMMIFNRLFNKKDYGNSGYADWLLLISMLLLTISGLIVELARFQNWHYAYHLYFFHLVCVWFVIMYLPYTKFGHLVYRTLALTHAASTGRNEPAHSVGQEKSPATAST